MKTFTPFLTLATMGLLLLTASAYATTRTWSGGGADNYWTDVVNWGGVQAPANNGDSLVFAGSTQQNNTNNYPAITNAAITFSTGGWTLNGSNVWLGGTLTSSTGTNVMNLNTPLTGTRTITVTACEFTMNGVVSGAFGVTTGGACTLVLGGFNTNTGTTTLTAGDGNVVLTDPHGLGSGSVSIPKAYGHPHTAIDAFRV